jgi:uncharacterized RDD family membrane protein YckC/ribosomal protein S27AE
MLLEIAGGVDGANPSPSVANWYNLLNHMAPETRYCSECGRATAVDELAHFGDRQVCAYCKAAYAQKLREGVAPVGVVTYAGFWIRFVAYVIDALILGVVMGIVQFAILGSFLSMPHFDASTRPEMIIGPMLGMIGIASLISIGLGCGYETFFISKYGATPGKMALSLKVVRPNGGPIDVGRAAGRYFGKILSGLILYIGFIMAGFDAEKKALHDIICDTRVIRTRS